MPYNSRADVVRLLAEQYNTKSNVKLSRFWSQLQSSYVSSHPEELWYNESLSVDDNIYINTHAHTYKSRSKCSKPCPDFKFVVHLSLSYGPAQKLRQKSEVVFQVS